VDIVDFFSDHLRSLSLAPSIAAVAGFIVYFLLSRFFRQRSTARHAARIVLFADVIAFPGVLIVLLLLSNRYEGFEITSSLRLLLLSLLVLTAVWLLNRFLYHYYWSDYFEKKYGTPAPKILPNIVTVVLFLLAVYVILTAVLGRSISGLLVSTGVLVGVIGLALQNLISDFFYGFSITLENPFYKGDWIEINDGTDGTVGQVVDISWHAIHLLSFNHSIYIVPNSTIARNTIHNLSRPTADYALWMTVSVDSAYPPELVRHLLTEAALSCSAVLTEPMPSINLSDGSGNPYVYTVYVYFRSFIGHYRGKNDLYMAVHQRLERAGIRPSEVKYAVATEETPPRSFSRPSIQEELAATEIFSPLSEEDIELLAAASYERTYHPGDTIIEEGSTDTSLLIITGGAVQVVKTDPRGREVEIDRFGAGDFIGEMALMTGRPRSATVRALVTVRGIIVPKEGLEPILTRNPALSEQIAGIMVERKMKDPQFSKRVQESPTPTSHLLKLYMDKVGRRIADFFKIKRE
jgi:small-conductance mechanosensitive channel